MLWNIISKFFKVILQIFRFYYLYDLDKFSYNMLLVRKLNFKTILCCNYINKCSVTRSSNIVRVMCCLQWCCRMEKLASSSSCRICLPWCCQSRAVNGSQAELFCSQHMMLGWTAAVCVSQVVSAWKFPWIFHWAVGKAGNCFQLSFSCELYIARLF